MTTSLTQVAGNARACRRLIQKIGQDKYDRWFGASLLTLSREALIVTVPSRFIADWIDSHYHDQLLEVAEVELGDGAEVRLRIDAQCKPPENITPPIEPIAPHARRGLNGEPLPLGAPPVAPRAQLPIMRRDALRYSLDDYVVGASNELAFTAACRSAEDNAGIDTLFIHGSCGLGKTHLLQGLCHRFAEQHPGAVWAYTTAEQFTNEYIHAVRNNRLTALRHKLRRLDLLAVDDVHFLNGKSATQNEFMHTFDAIEQSGAKLVMASDAHPKLIRETSDALVSRFMSGMVVKVSTPDPDTRVRIVHALAKRRGMTLMDGVARQIAAQSPGSVREIEGMLTKLSALAHMDRGIDAHARPIGHALTARLLDVDDVDGSTRKPVRLEHIIEVACRTLNVERSQIMSKSRHRRIVLARSVAIYVARQLTTLSYPELARALGRSNHSTIVTAAQRIKDQIDHQKPLPLVESLEVATIDQLADLIARRAVEEANHQ
ncbi:MAG: hypothetical protein GC159_08610 [Phycisphaera sp.]|nr:hypothetical protein [Phycisphaera sp.]